MQTYEEQNGFQVAYNPQTAVDSETHLIRDFDMTSQVTDHGLIYDTMKDTKSENPDKVIEAVADKGYADTGDMVECLENGVIPHVICDDGSDGYDIEIPYEEVADTNPASTKPEDLKKCLHAGEIPEAYRNVISRMEVADVRRKVSDEPECADAAGTPNARRNKASEKGHYEKQRLSVSSYNQTG